MKLSKSIRRNGRPSIYVPGVVRASGRFSAPANEPPAGGGDPGSGGTGGTDPNAGAPDKKYTDDDVNRIGARHKAEGKAAAEKAMADALGCTIEEAKVIIAKAREAEDKTKSDAQKDREAAAKELADANTAKTEAATEKHLALIDRALGKLGFSGDDDAAARVQKMVTAEVGSSFDDVLKDVTELKKTLNPELFGEKPEGKGGGRIPNGDPKGGAPKPKGGEDAYARGAERFKAQQKPGYDPTKKTA